MAITPGGPGSPIPTTTSLNSPSGRSEMRAMNGTAPQIEIIAPFRAAFEWMKMVLFRPFDVAKWLTIAFAAFISGSWGGGGGGGNFSKLGRLGNGDWKYRATRHGDLDWNVAPWIIAGVIGIVVIALLLGIIWMWVSSRGRFIFTDCVVKNRGAIVEPRREYRRQGNSFFLFSLVVACAMVAIIAIAGLFLWLCFFGMRDDHFGAGTVIGVIGLVVIVLIWIAFSLFFAVVSTFMIPVMYRRRCLAREEPSRNRSVFAAASCHRSIESRRLVIPRSVIRTTTLLPLAR